MLMLQVVVAAAWLTGSHKGRKRGVNQIKLVGIDLSRRRGRQRIGKERKERNKREQKTEGEAGKSAFFTFHSCTFEYEKRPLRLQVQF